jgi:hypothetical protein
VNKAIGNAGPEVRQPTRDDRWNRCESCGANLDLVTPWNQPHICKELTYGTPVVPTRFLPLEAEGES